MNSDLEKEFKERFEKEEKERNERFKKEEKERQERFEKEEKERKERFEKKEKERKYQEWKKTQLKPVKTNLNQKTGKLSRETYVLLVLIIVIASVLIFSMNKKQLSLTVPEALKKIETSEAMEICAGTRGADPRKVAPSSDLDLEIQLVELSKREGMEPYVANSFNKIYYHVVGWGDGSKNRPEQTQELTDGCTYLINNDEEFSKEFNRVWGKKLEEGKRLAEDQASADLEARAKFAPILDKWDKKLGNLGGGGLLNYLRASSAAENLIKSGGAAYSLTGVSRGEIQSVDCDATTRSRWSSGVPLGWWACLIDLEGSDYEYFSIEFTQNSWRGTPDGSRQAGRTLDLDIPQDLIEWFAKQQASN
jgi:hypothetical protein